jgi:hypothetical protein
MDKPKRRYDNQRKQKEVPKKEEDVTPEVPVKKVAKHPLDRYYNPITGSRYEVLAD